MSRGKTMQIILRLYPESSVRLEFNYYPKLAAALYEVLSSYDREFASNLHDGRDFQGRIKLFGFSPLYSRETEVHPVDPIRNHSGGLVFKGVCALIVCSPWPELMSRIEQGAKETRMLRIGSQLLNIQTVMMVPPPMFREKMKWAFKKPTSCVTAWTVMGEKRKIFAMPDEPAGKISCAELLRNNLIHKWRRLKEVRPDIVQAWLEDREDINEQDISIQVLPISNKNAYQRKSHQIKRGPVFSWIAPVRVDAPAAIQKLVWSCGLGQMNSMGFGVVEEERQ